MELCDGVRQTAFDLHTFLRHGHLEQVYENGLAHRLGKTGLKVEQQHPLQWREVVTEYVKDYVSLKALTG